MNIDQWAYTSKLKNKDPVQKIFFALLTICVCLWANTISISILIVMMMVCLTVTIGGIPPRVFFKLMVLPMSFLLISVATIAISRSSDSQNFLTAVHFGSIWIGISKLGLITSLKLFFKSLGAVSCLYFLSLNTPMVDLMAALGRLRVPNLLIELMSLIYRFIFVLLETADTIFTAQNSRLGYSRLSFGYRSLGVLVASLFIRAYRRSDELYTALESRGYDGELNVLNEPYEKNWNGYIGALGLNVIFITGTLVLKRFAFGGVF
jgi:cobalt/nickel transport system permease protein